ncbi:allantoinase AllB [Halobacillus sp. ACCC02827]|uniref:allantoinase AllB n=1 Tax=Halobacillus sp. ACCC02827 TaxID=3052090 RepID=UPI002570DDA0|nr:allantoinase AllB [Halobacillus sp. ACCC02827]WJE15221.1 allantoinase AllB [Halobacillus sp. ACCC02827]
MQWDLKIINGTIVTGSAMYEADVYVKEGKIAAITKEQLQGACTRVVDAEGKHVLPGLIDTHIHSRDPGPTYKEDFAHSTRAAAMGGITTVFEMPNTNPPVNTPENFDLQQRNLDEKAYVDYGLWGICLGPMNLDSIQGLNDKGVIGFKFFWGYAVHEKTFQLLYNYEPGMDDVIPPFDDGDVLEMMEEVAKTGKRFAVHAESSDLIQKLTSRVKDSGSDSYAAFLEGRPNLAESLTVNKGIELAKATGARLHILHVSSEEGVTAVKRAQEEGYPITVETCPHYLFLSDEDYPAIGTSMKVYPPVKFKKDQDAIWEAVRNGTISHICSDHAPHTAEEKTGDLWSIPAGMCGVETMVPLMLNAVHDGKITLPDVVRLLAETPAKLFGIHPQKGTLQVGADADVTIVDMNQEDKIDQERLQSKSKVTAFDGFSVKGLPVMTIVRGNIVMDERVIVGDQGGGRIVKPVETREILRK